MILKQRNEALNILRTIYKLTSQINLSHSVRSRNDRVQAFITLNLANLYIDENAEKNKEKIQKLYNLVFDYLLQKDSTLDHAKKCLSSYIDFCRKTEQLNQAAQICAKFIKSVEQRDGSDEVLTSIKKILKHSLLS